MSQGLRYCPNISSRGLTDLPSRLEDHHLALSLINLPLFIREVVRGQHERVRGVSRETGAERGGCFVPHLLQQHYCADSLVSQMSIRC